jgi:hypothetical protein
VEAVRTRGARLAARAAAGLLAAGVTAWIAAGAADAWGWPLAALGVLAAVLAVAGAPPAWPAALLGTEYAAALEVAGRARTDGRAAAVAVALVVVAELLAWARELEPDVPHERGVIGRRVVRIGLVALGTGAIASAILILAAAPLELGLAGDALGVCAAVAALAVAARLARPLH